MVFFEEIILYVPGKFWFCKILPFFGQNWLFWEFLTSNFQTQTWIFLIFGMEILWILTLSGEPIILCLVFAVLALFGSKIHCMWWRNGVFGRFWPIYSNILMLYGQVLLYEHYLLFINEKMNWKFWHQIFWPVLDLFW